MPHFPILKISQILWERYILSRVHKIIDMRQPRGIAPTFKSYDLPQEDKDSIALNTDF